MVPGLLIVSTRAFEAVSVLLLGWGGVVVLLRLGVSEWHHLRDRGDRVRFEQIRVEFGQRIVLATEFLIAADLTHHP